MMHSPYKREQAAAEIWDDGTKKRVAVEVGWQEHSSGYSNASCQFLSFSDDVEMTYHPPTPDHEKICYGALCDAQIQVESMEALRTPTASSWSRFYTLVLVFREKVYQLLHANDMTLRSLGTVDLITAAHLQSLEKFPAVSFIAVVSSTSLRPATRITNSKKKILPISVNVIGPVNLLDEVGDMLAERSAYLQHPFFLEAGIRYVNPQYLFSKNEHKDLRHLIGPPLMDSRSMQISRGVEEALESLHSDSVPTDSPLGRHVSATCKRFLLRKLQRHQEKGVEFIINREDFAFCDRVTSDLLSLTHLQDNNTWRKKHALSPCLGGIVADVMGLGKTLTMLSAIIYLKSDAKKFAQINNEVSVFTRTGATLVVVTSRQVLDVWVSEIVKHVVPGNLNCILFHGDKRAKTPEALLDGDIVLTTYNTLVSDCSRNRLLQSMNWFRVVLDEAHWIRNRASKQFKAAESLTAERRWCLTGTPIQNSMDDLLSLLKFIRFEPFSAQSIFQKSIVEPLQVDRADRFRNLKLLLRVICLRRNVGLLDLSPAETENVSISLSQLEKEIYENTLKNCQAEFDRLVSTNSEIKKYNVLFTTIMKLRRICNHGTFPTSSPGGSTPSGQGKGSARSSSNNPEALCEFCGTEDEDAAALLDGLEVCPECSRPLHIRRKSRPPTTSSESLSPLPRENQNGSLPFDSPQPANDCGQGYSTKLTAVTANIRDHLHESKSLVFTSWRSTLDILGQMLNNQGIPFLRIDGRVKLLDRIEILSKFREDASIRVLLMSIETGAVGLTLTVANRVHIVEPQWNPSVEEQAVARALRMGQDKTVTVIRYITEHTVERNILALQKKKSLLAKFSLDSAADGDESGQLDDLKFVLDTSAQ